MPELMTEIDAKAEKTEREWQAALQNAAVVPCLKAFKIKYLFQCPPSGLLIEAL